MDRAELERLDRESLVMRAQGAGIRRARVLTRPELVDELLRLDPDIDASQLKKTRGFFGLARDLLSKVVERGLHLPDAADRLRAALGNQLPQVPRPEPQAVPTVTLAEIYAAQGHKQRAIETLKRVLESEPEHGTARTLLEKLQAADYVAPPLPLPPEPDEPRDEIGAHLGTPVPEDAEVMPAAAPLEEIADRGSPTSSEPATLRLDEPKALPLSFTQSECIAIPLPRGRTYVWWRLSDEAERAAKAGRFCVRVLVLLPTWDGPKKETRDLACDPSTGELVLEDLPERAIVRVAIGLEGGSSFVPLAHSPALERSALRELVEWTPEGTTAIALEGPDASSIACAAEAAARRIG